MPKITIGRDESDIEEYGEKTGTALIGKHILGEKKEAHTANPVRMDIARPHVMGIFGKRGQGKCVTPETEILLEDGSLVEAEQLFEQYSGETVGGDKDEDICSPREQFSVVSLGEDLKTTTSQVTHLYRKHVDENLVRITTSQGREITVTKEHPLLTTEGWKESQHLEEGNTLALPTSILLNEELQQLSVPSAFEEAAGTGRGWRQQQVLSSLQTGEKPVSEISDGSGSFYRLIQTMEDNGLIETHTNSPTVAAITAEGEKRLERQDQAVKDAGTETYYRYGRSQPIQVPETVDERFARFMALLLSEGHEQTVDETNYRILFSNTSTELMEMFTDTVETLFGITPKHADQHDVYFNSRALEVFLQANGYKTGATSAEKEIPSFILSSPAPIRRAFLQVFFEAEGSVSNSTIELSTASDDIANKLIYLLGATGIFAKRTVKEKYAANTEEQTRREYNVLTITGKQNLELFQENIGFITDRKTQRLAAEIPENGNPNIDTIPHAGGLVQEVREALGMSRGDVKTHKQSLKAYEDGEYAFTQDHLQRVTDKLEQRLDELEDLRDSIANNPNTDAVERLIELSRVQWSAVNTALGYSRADRKFITYQKFQDRPELKKLRNTVITLFDEHHDLSAIRERINRLKNLVTADVFWDCITDIQPVPYRGYVYDLTVESTHNFVAGIGGIISHNSYTMGVLAEELMNADDAVQDNISTIMIDSMGIFWSMKNSNDEQGTLLDRWGLAPQSMDIDLYIPEGHRKTFHDREIPFDRTFAIKPGELNSGDWALAFDIEPTHPMGILLERVINELQTAQGTDYSIQDLIDRTEGHDEFDVNIRRALVNRFETADNWGIFSTDGTTVDELTKRGSVTVLDVSMFENISRGWSVRSLVVGLLARKILKRRMESKRIEEIEEMEGVPTSDSPIVWMLIDEAHQYIPDDGQTPASNPILQWAKIGREPGVSICLATQQPARINSKVLSQMDLMLTHRLTAKSDIAALGEIMQTYMRYDITDYIDNLPRQNGAAIVLDDNSERVYPVQVRPRMSWHAGGTPTAIKKGRT